MMSSSRVINIVGAGLAGMSAAIELAKLHIPCRLISSQPSERAQSVLAEGGINAALNVMGEEDDPSQHFEDTMRGGRWLADPNAVEGFVKAAPEITEWLRSIGVPFQMEDGRLIQRNFGGQKKKRTSYAKSSTGKILASALIDDVRKYESAGLVRRFAHHTFLKLAVTDGGPNNKDDGTESYGSSCCGLYLRDEYSKKHYFAPGPVILCFGGCNGLFPGATTGTTQNSGDALASVLDQGVTLANLEFIQYHPTTARISGKCMLISEAARGEGGRLFVRRNGAPWYFLEEKYPELKNLMPRDVISREIAFLDKDPACEKQVYLDLRGLTKDIWKHRLSDLREEISYYMGIDPATTPVPIRPGIHYFMGGIYVDEKHRTSMNGLYAAGECASQYHGANRLGGNSMLGALYGGKVAAQTAASGLLEGEYSANSPFPLELAEIQGTDEKESVLTPGLAEHIGRILQEGLGILRDQDSMEKALKELHTCVCNTAADFRRLQLARAMLICALSRKESRGAHYRIDFPVENDVFWQKTSCISNICGQLSYSTVPLPERRGRHD